MAYLAGITKKLQLVTAILILPQRQTALVAKQTAEVDVLSGGRLRLASFPTAGATIVPLAVAEFSQGHPGIELSLVEAEPEESVPRLKAGELEIALVFEYSSLPRSACTR